MKRSPMPPRRAPLVVRTPLARGAQLLRARKAARRRPDTGFDRPTKARILDRDNHACVSCDITAARSPLTVHHRINRGMGGDPTVNTVLHGLAMCWPCNGLMESSPGRATQARSAGWKLRRGQDPAAVPVLYPDGRRWLLLADGTRRPA